MRPAPTMPTRTCPLMGAAISDFRIFLRGAVFPARARACTWSGLRSCATAAPSACGFSRSNRRRGLFLVCVAACRLSGEADETHLQAADLATIGAARKETISGASCARADARDILGSQA